MPNTLILCRRPGSNRHGYYYPRDFKSRASANSATAAILSYHIRATAQYVRSTQWTFGDSNPGPTGYEPVALTN